MSGTPKQAPKDESGESAGSASALETSTTASEPSVEGLVEDQGFNNVVFRTDSSDSGLAGRGRATTKGTPPKQRPVSRDVRAVTKQQLKGQERVAEEAIPPTSQSPNSFSEVEGEQKANDSASTMTAAVAPSPILAPFVTAAGVVERLQTDQTIPEEFEALSTVMFDRDTIQSTIDPGRQETRGERESRIRKAYCDSLGDLAGRVGARAFLRGEDLQRRADANKGTEKKPKRKGLSRALSMKHAGLLTQLATTTTTTVLKSNRDHNNKMDKLLLKLEKYVATIKDLEGDKLEEFQSRRKEGLKGEWLPSNLRLADGKKDQWLHGEIFFPESGKLPIMAVAAMCGIASSRDSDLRFEFRPRDQVLAGPGLGIRPCNGT